MLESNVYNGKIDLDSEFATKIGFTSDNFDGYLWKLPGLVVLSFILSKNPGKGNFSKLLQTIESLDLGIRVPTPSPKMQQILLKKGFQPKVITDKFGEVYVLEKHPDKTVKE